MKIDKPLVKRPESENELERLKVITETRIEDIKKKESELKKEYSLNTTEFKNRIMALQQQLKKEKSNLSKIQLDNRKERRSLANERIRLQYDLEHLKSRFSGFVYGGRMKVSNNPNLAFDLMDKKRGD